MGKSGSNYLISVHSDLSSPLKSSTSSSTAFNWLLDTDDPPYGNAANGDTILVEAGAYTVDNIWFMSYNSTTLVFQAGAGGNYRAAFLTPQGRRPVLGDPDLTVAQTQDMGDSKKGTRAAGAVLRSPLPRTEEQEMRYFADVGRPRGGWNGTTAGWPNVGYTVSSASPSNVYNAAQLRANH